MKKTTRWIALLAVGIALFVVLSLCLQVPVFENYYLCLGYVVMAVYCYSFGTAAGTLVGFLGVILYCVVISGLRGMPGWALGNIVIGVILGLTFRATKKMKRKALRTVIDIAAIAASTALGILAVKSETECLLYAQPFLVRAGKNVYAFVADLVVLIVSLPICAVLDRPAKKIFPELTGAGKSPLLLKRGCRAKRGGRFNINSRPQDSSIIASATELNRSFVTVQTTEER